MCVGIDGKDRCQKIQFECCFHVLLRLTNDKVQKLEGFAYIIEIQNNPKKHWSDLFKWDMAMILCDIVMCKMKKIIGVSRFIPVFIDDVLQLIMIIGSISMYIWLRSGKWISILFTFEKVTLTCYNPNFELATKTKAWQK